MSDDLRSIGHWIGGTADPGAPGRTAPVFDPARGVQTADVALASAAEVDAVVQVARRAAATWNVAPLSRRTTMLFRLRELIDANRGRLAAAITAEHGKVLSDAEGEVARGLECVEFACGIPQLLKGAFNAEVSTGVDVHTLLQPVGVVAGITPFNFPAMVPLWMLSNALACGNAFILKPSEKDPSASLLLAELIAEAGFPEGVFNVVQGDVEAVNALLAHPGIDAVSFVGSTPVARHIYETGTSAGKRVQALGGAKNHMVVLPDADIDAAADAAINAGYGSAGERCMAISVVVAVGDVCVDGLPGVHDERLVARLDRQRPAEDERVLVELRRLPRLDPAGGARHPGDADSFRPRVHASHELLDPLREVPGGGDDRRLPDEPCHDALLLPPQGAFGQAGHPLSKTIRHRPGPSRRQIDVNVATVVPAGSRTGPVLRASVPESSTSTCSGSQEKGGSFVS